MKSSNLKFILTLLSIVSLFCIYLPLPETVSAQKIGSESKPKSSNVIPTSPPACTPTTNNFSNTTPVPILDNTAVTSTINVTGAGTYLWDVDLQTFITHTFNADLDFTIQSPAGTIVTVSTDNGGSFDDVYNGTLFDDDANPLGQVPYTNNNGMVTDNLYVDLTTATPLTPEEPLAAFLGEDPNGIWTLTIYDDAGGDTGALNMWNLNITTFTAVPAETTNNFSNTTPVPILDNTAVTSTINVAALSNVISKVTLQTFITHTFNADLDFTIQSPAGTIVTVSTDNGGSFDDVYNGTLFDDDANPLGQVPYTNNNGMVTDNLYVDLTTATPLTPEEPLAAFLGEDPNGIWTLTIYDDAGGDTGSLNSWNLNITTAACTTAAGVSVFGKVVTRSGRGIYGATVSLTDLQGTTRISRTNPFGYFSFEDIGVGQTYIVTTRSRNYDFNQFTMNIDDNVTNLVITAEN